MIAGKKTLSSKILWGILTILIGLFHFIPLYISINVAFKPKTDLSSRWMIPTKLYLDNFIFAAEKAKIFLAIQNSLIITVLSITVIVLIGGMAAYPLARNRSRFNDRILQFVLAVMMVPPLSMLVPLVTIMTRMGAVSSYWGIIVVLVTFQLPISIFLYTNFIRTIPGELDEAALIDGCSKFSIFYKIILPLLKPVTATVVILTGVAIWNDYQFSLFLLQSPKMKVVTLAVSSFFAQSSSNLGAAAASAIIAVLPVALMFLFLQRFFIQGMVDSAVKG
ncbi:MULTISPECIES: carbohydrate ABC transporter permease [unclassified Oceanispirochaeta]|uniref:carbohydrate ABC transporter permease n=1 Tax=unclassified Oceanispirochaeta TaxID=2635722 RepID=UPI000E09009E|nr:MULTISPECIES: carbohydrate ABC transporter permease [unclassified Oceanispirochaeta]MBF9014920.1 carbohydrate ABC transporter permease [Oceanispirochaeta sp. M2]NPD71399.1 carbohydrate ABC transporter permease [Oceanispirochaeta sp. M1]RDG33363.1 carbohydrate ABC transporter permease [Oceanispirochaeta sp. M1]